jgi:chemotaxis signal transduction protein
MTQATSTAAAAESYILFEIAGTTYGVRSSVVQQVQMIDHVTPVPNAIPVVEGVVHSRGRVIPALNLRVRFGFQKVPFDLRSRLVVINPGGRSVGLVVDTAREFVHIPDASIEVPPEGITRLSGKYLNGIATVRQRLILILNIEEVIDVSGLEDMAAEFPS